MNTEDIYNGKMDSLLILSNICANELKQINKSKPYVQCSQCFTRKTPLWRRGPYGIATLCNSCGLKYKRIIS
jgi:hypothetical protein